MTNLSNGPRRFLARLPRLWREALTLGALLMAGCASFDSPVDQLAKTQAAVRAAEESGADKVDPQSQLYLKLAREQLDKGKTMMEDDNEKADRLLRRSEADAELAREIAHVVTAQLGASDAKKILQKLKPVN